MEDSQLKSQTELIAQHPLLASLNDSQRAAVLHGDGPAMVLAGAGSGKTRVLVTRVAWLVTQYHVDPTNILLVTFTNKAAAEMNERVERLVGTKLPFSGTFHRICARILRIDGKYIGLPDQFVIFDSDDQQQLVKSVMKELNYDFKEFKPSAILGMISNAKNELLSPDEYRAVAKGKFQEAAGRVYANYQYQLKQNYAVDFDDLLLKTIELFKTQPQVLGKYQKKFEYVLVDEYQDTNKAQYVLTMLLAAPQNNLFVVGDAAQAIYSWRGADYRNLNQLKRDFPDLMEYRLEQNYRSTQTILDAASNVIQNNTTHPILELWTDRVHIDEQIQLFGLSDQQSEAQKVADTIWKSYDKDEYDTIAVLYRVNAQSRAFEEAFLRMGIPYKIVGGVKFYARKEVKDLLSYLRLVLNPNDSVSLERVSKIGKRRYQQFDTWRAGLLSLAVELTPLEMLDQIISATSYKDLFDAHDPEDQSRLENIEELRSVASQFTQLFDFLENVALVDNSASSSKDTADRFTDQPQPMITLMSLHSAKGLEYQTVFLVGLEEGLFPHSRSLMDKEQMEEERRLCYVGITRAKQTLYLTYAQERFLHGSSSFATASRFIKEIPPDLIKEEIVKASYSASPIMNRWQKFGANRFSPYNSYGRPATTQQPVRPTERRRVVVDDAELDDILSGNIDVDAWLKE